MFLERKIYYCKMFPERKFFSKSIIRYYISFSPIRSEIYAKNIRFRNVSIYFRDSYSK